MRLAFPVFVLALVALMFTGTGSSAAAGAPSVRSTSFELSGQNLVWRVQLNRGFTAAGLARQNATLCLLINPAVHRQKVCLKQGRRGPALVVSYAGRRRTIAAAVTQPTRTTLRAQFTPSAIGQRNRNFIWQTQTTGPGSASALPAEGQEMNLRPSGVVGCVPTGPKFVDHGPTTAKVVALTYDDGPWKATPQILNILEQKHVVATFFQVGERVAQYAALDRRMLRDGDIIGNHSWNHEDLKYSRNICDCQMKRTNGEIRRVTGFTPCLFRPPYGEITNDEIDDAREYGMTVVGWSVDPKDWARPGANAIVNIVTTQIDPGGIILDHDGSEPGVKNLKLGNRTQTIAALPRFIDTLRSEGYSFVTIPQLLGYRLKYKK